MCFYLWRWGLFCEVVLGDESFRCVYFGLVDNVVGVYEVVGLVGVFEEGFDYGVVIVWVCICYYIVV